MRNRIRVRDGKAHSRDTNQIDTGFSAQVTGESGSVAAWMHDEKCNNSRILVGWLVGWWLGEGWTWSSEKMSELIGFETRRASTTKGNCIYFFGPKNLSHSQRNIWMWFPWIKPGWWEPRLFISHQNPLNGWSLWIWTSSHTRSLSSLCVWLIWDANPAPSLKVRGTTHYTIKEQGRGGWENEIFG